MCVWGGYIGVADFLLIYLCTMWVFFSVCSSFAIHGIQVGKILIWVIYVVKFKLTFFDFFYLLLSH